MESEGTEGPTEGHGKTPQASEGGRMESEGTEGPSEGHGKTPQASEGGRRESDGAGGPSEGPAELRKVPNTNSRPPLPTLKLGIFDGSSSLETFWQNSKTAVNIIHGV